VSIYFGLGKPQHFVPCPLDRKRQFACQLADCHPIEKAQVMTPVAVRRDHKKLAREFLARAEEIDAREQSGNGHLGAKENILDGDSMQPRAKPFIQPCESLVQHRVKEQSCGYCPIDAPRIGLGKLTALATRLRQLGTPVIGRVHGGALWLDVRAIDDADALCASLDGL